MFSELSTLEKTSLDECQKWFKVQSYFPFQQLTNINSLSEIFFLVKCPWFNFAHWECECDGKRVCLYQKERERHTHTHT